MLWSMKSKPKESKPVGRFVHLLPEGHEIPQESGIAVAISPDGTKIAYAANGQLYLRKLNEFAANPIQGTGNAQNAILLSGWEMDRLLVTR